jgi:hypothetical protein
MPTPAPFEVAKEASQPADQLVVSTRGSRCRSRLVSFRDVDEAGVEHSLSLDSEFAHTARIKDVEPSGEK